MASYTTWQSKGKATNRSRSKGGKSKSSQSELDLDRENGDEDLDNDDLQTLMSDAATSEAYLGMVWHMGYLGVAYYDTASLQVHVMPDALEHDDFSLVKQVICQIQPTVIVVSTVQDARLLACIRKTASELNPGSPGQRPQFCKIEFLPNADFNHGVCTRRILSMNLPSMPKHLNEEERKLYFSSLIPWNATNMLRSVGGLLKYLDKKRVGVELEDLSTNVPILGFRAFSLENIIQIDQLTYTALNIFDTELHPSVYKFGSGGSKEGFSLFGILNRCKSSIGSRMMRQWFTRPVKNASLLNQRHDAVTFFMAPCNMEVTACLRECLKKIKHVSQILHRMSKAQATVGDWMIFSRTLCHAVSIGKCCKAQTQDVEILRKISMAFTDDLEKCACLISRTVDFQESKNKKRFVVMPHVDQTLDEKRRTFDGMPHLMFEAAQAEIEHLSEDIPHCMVSYIPQVGYLLVIDMPEGKSDTDDNTIDGLQLKFVSNNQLYYKSPRTVELDRLLGDTQIEILDLEVSIKHQLQSSILKHSQLILDALDMAAELDCLLALAECAEEFNYSRPQLVQQGVIEVKDGRHPLQELCCSPFVCNHTDMSETSGKMKLITGPNACGKSVYLKQVALIVFMAHIGSFVPAQEANIGPVDAIFSRIKAVESVCAGQSTFQQDIVQVAQALRRATSSSLVVIDEFGKGTEPTDGLSLLTAVLNQWLSKGPGCPLALVSTHFHSIIQHKLLTSLSSATVSPQIEFLTLETVVNGEDLVFLYQIKTGHSSLSYACNTATQVGMKPDIIRRAKQVSKLLSEHKAVPHVEDVNIEARNRGYDKIVNAFLRLNLKTDNLRKFLEDFVIPVSEEHEKVTPTVEVQGSPPEQAQQVPQLPARPLVTTDQQITNTGQATSSKSHKTNEHLSELLASAKQINKEAGKNKGEKSAQESSPLVTETHETNPPRPTQPVRLSVFKNPSTTLEHFERTPLLDKSKLSDRNRACPGLLMNNPSPDDVRLQDRNFSSKRKIHQTSHELGDTSKISKHIERSPISKKGEMSGKMAQDKNARKSHDFSFLTPILGEGAKGHQYKTPEFYTTEATTDQSGSNGTDTRRRHTTTTTTSSASATSGGDMTDVSSVSS